MRKWYRHQHVIFDCDSTLSRIEGIDELAKIAGVMDQVKSMTDAAMAGEIDLEEVYGRRLALIKPTQSDIFTLRQAYKNTATLHAKQVIEVLKAHGHDVYIVSGGLMEPVCEFGLTLGVPEDNIRAVGVDYNHLSGQWWLNNQTQSSWSPEYMGFHQSPLTLSEGKKSIINELVQDKPGRRMMIGDGVSDLLAAGEVDAFVGYGGIISRDKVASAAEIFIRCESLMPVLALAGGESLITSMKDTDADSYKKSLYHLTHNVNFTELDIRNYLLSLYN